MEITLLSKTNAHRAKMVKMANNPNSSEYEFIYRNKQTGYGIFSTFYTHAAVSEGIPTDIPDREQDLKNWIVTAWKYEDTVEDLYKDLVSAYTCTSHVPEERALQRIREYDEDLQDLLKTIPEDHHADFKQKYRDWVVLLTSKHTRIASWAIVGPAGFNVERNRRASDSYDKSLDEFTRWCNSYADRCEREKRRQESPEETASREWEELKTDIMNSATACLEIDLGKTVAYRSAFTTSIFGRLERVALKGKKDLVERGLDLIRHIQSDFFGIGLKKPLFTDRHKIWNLPKVAEDALIKLEQKADRENSEIILECGCHIIKNYKEDRLQLRFNGKPESDVISRLKTQAFRWSRTNVCWQRQLTSNSYYAAARVFYPDDFQMQKDMVSLIERF